MKLTLLLGDCLHGLRSLPDESVHCCVTSPPYWGLRDYGHADQIGRESTVDSYVTKLVEVFHEVRRVLRSDGTCWVNLGDSYGGKKQLAGAPWRVAFALQADGWLLRQDIIWHKPNPMPESVSDRCTKAHEYIFLLAKTAQYYYDATAVREPCSEDMQRRAAAGHTRGARGKLDASRGDATSLRGEHARVIDVSSGRNRRSVWTVAQRPYKGAHFATFPADLIDPCIRAGSPQDGVVLDPFAGSGTTLALAKMLGRSAIGCEINPQYADLIKERVDAVNPLFGQRLEITTLPPQHA